LDLEEMRASADALHEQAVKIRQQVDESMAQLESSLDCFKAGCNQLADKVERLVPSDPEPKT
jgi:uncharacterized coiled-coil DUF342 family protein